MESCHGCAMAASAFQELGRSSLPSLQHASVLLNIVYEHRAQIDAVEEGVLKELEANGVNVEGAEVEMLKASPVVQEAGKRRNELAEESRGQVMSYLTGLTPGEREELREFVEHLSRDGEMVQRALTQLSSREALEGLMKEGESLGIAELLRRFGEQLEAEHGLTARVELRDGEFVAETESGEFVSKPYVPTSPNVDPGWASLRTTDNVVLGTGEVLHWDDINKTYVGDDGLARDAEGNYLTFSNKEEAEDAEDLAMARAAMAEPGEPVKWEDLKKEFVAEGNRDLAEDSVDRGIIER